MVAVKDAFVLSGNGALYQECMQEMANARKAKQEELARAAAKKKKLMTQIKQVALIALVCVFLVPAAVGALLAYLTR